MTDKVECRLFFFAKARELMGCSEQKAFFPKAIKGDELKQLIFDQMFPQLSSLKQSSVLAVDQSYVTVDQMLTLADQMEVAIIPPLSGG